MGDTERLATLRRKLVEHLGIEDVRDLCLDLGIRFDDLGDGGLSTKISQLLDRLNRTGRVPNLVAWCVRQYPNIAWPEFIESTTGDPNAQSPFKGLAFYDVADADLFVGREVLTAELIGRLPSPPTPLPGGEGSRSRFLAITGASGSGKSSLVRAGMVATLQGKKPLAEGELPTGCKDWLYRILTPTDRPLEALATALALPDESELSTARFVDELGQDKRILHFRAQKLTGDSKRRLLLVVDQFEEVFTACKDKTQRKAFIDNLLYASSGAHDGPAIVLLTLRADFYAQCFDFDNLREALGQHQAPIGAMDAGELHRSVVEPAFHSGFAFEPGLVDLLLRDVGDEPGALPLLSHALLETWQRRDGRTLTLAGYQASGGVRGAIAKTADSTLAKLNAAQQAIARRIFVVLTELGEGAQDTRRRASLAELARAPDEAGAVAAVLKVLADARLVTTDRDANSDELAEVAHEALIREWPALRGWLEEDRAGERIRRQLADDAREWVRLNRDPGALYRGARLAQAGEWAGANSNIAAESREFLEASQTAVAREAEEREAQRQRELAAAKKLAEAEAKRAEEQRHANVRLRTRNIVLALATVVAVGLAVAAFVLANQANAQAIIAKSQALAAQALANQERALDLSLLLSVEALHTAPTFEARSDLLDTLQHSPGLNQFGRAHTAGVWSVAFAPDGKTLAFGSEDKTVILWDVSDPRAPKPLGSPLTAHTDSVLSVAFAPDGKTLASGSGDKTVILWDVSDPRAPKPLGSPLTAHTSDVWSVAFAPDGKTLASGSGDKTVILWDVSDPRAPKPLGSPLTAHTSHVWSVAFAPDGKTLASGSWDKTVILWDVSDPRAPKPLGSPLTAHTAVVMSVAFAPDGKTLASGSLDTTVILWDVSDPRAPKPLGSPLTAHTDSVLSVAFAPDGKTLASGSLDTTVILWDVSDPRAPKPLGSPLTAHTSRVLSVAFAPDGRTLASGSWDKTVILWDVGSPLTAHTSRVLSVAFAPDGKTLASGSLDTTVILWDVSDPRAPKPLGSPLTAHTDSVLSVAFAPDGKTLASGSGDKTVILWDVSDPRAPKPLGSPLTAHTSDVWSVAFAPDGKTLASGSGDKTVILWDVSDPRAPKPLGSPLTAHTAVVLSVAFAPDGKTLASGSGDKTVILWDVSDPRAPKPLGSPLTAHTDSVLSVAFAPDGKTLASGSWDKTVILWDVSDPRAPKPLGSPLTAHTSRVLSVAFAPDGKTLASGSGDKTVILWDVSDPRAPKPLGSPLTAHTSHVLSVAFAPDGKTLASGSLDSTLILWDVDVESWVRRACRIANRNLKQAEWGRYLPDTPYRKTCPQWPAGD